MTDKVRLKLHRVLRRGSGTTSQTGERIRYTDCYMVWVQKKTSGERLKVSNDKEGRFESTEDVFSFPPNGSVSPHPFHVDFYVYKEAAGDDDDYLMYVLLEQKGTEDE